MMTNRESGPPDRAEGEAESKSVGRPPPAALVRSALAHAGVLFVRLIGPPGAGKTELIESTLKRLLLPYRVAVIAVHPASTRDARRLEKHCGMVAHLDMPVPSAAAVWRFMSQLPLAEIDTLLLEGSSGMAPLADIGQDATAAILSISGGDDKAAEYATLLESASLVLLTKSDIRPVVRFDDQVFRDDLRNVNSVADVLELSAMSGKGMERWVDWLERASAAKKRRMNHGDAAPPSADLFVG